MNISTHEWPKENSHDAALSLLEWIEEKFRVRGQVDSDDSISFDAFGRGISVDVDREVWVYRIEDGDAPLVGKAQNFRELTKVLNKAMTQEAI
tara:strand:- start:61 stop:339 length:279 start_codon:yes stop_codon:yes gene_type:complete